MLNLHLIIYILLLLSRVLVNHLMTCLCCFSLRNNNIGSKGAKFLAEALKMNQVLTSIKLSIIALQLNWHTQNSSLFTLVGVFAQFPRLLISFQNNAIEEEGAQSLAEVLQCNRKLVSLKWVWSCLQMLF